METVTAVDRPILQVDRVRLGNFLVTSILEQALNNACDKHLRDDEVCGILLDAAQGFERAGNIEALTHAYYVLAWATKSPRRLEWAWRALALRATLPADAHGADMHGHIAETLADLLLDRDREAEALDVYESALVWDLKHGQDECDFLGGPVLELAARVGVDAARMERLREMDRVLQARAAAETAVAHVD